MPSEINVGGGEFKASFFSGSLSHNLSASSPLTITPPAGKTLRLDALTSEGAGSIEGTSVSIGGEVVIGPMTLSNSQTVSSGTFVINIGITANTREQTSNTVQPLIAFDSDQEIVISTTSASARTVYFSYSYGD